jgi:hypothetical protein
MAILLAPVMPAAIAAFFPWVMLCSLLGLVAVGLNAWVGRRAASGLMLALLLASFIVVPLLATTTPNVPIGLDCLGLPWWLCVAF